MRGSGKYAAGGRIWGEEEMIESGVWASGKARPHRGRDAVGTRQQGRAGFGEGQGDPFPQGQEGSRETVFMPCGLCFLGGREKP